MRTLRRAIAALVIGAVVAALLFVAWGIMRGRPQDLPWTPLDLGAPVGLFTGRKLTALGSDFPQCQRLLDKAGVRYTVLPPRRDSAQCGYDDAVRLTGTGAQRIGYRPAGLGIACPVAAALSLWEWTVVQPAAQKRFGSRVTAIDHFGSYNCRRISGRDSGTWSEHATADAVDIAGFRLADGRRITVARDWTGGADNAAFLREVRDGACRLFATTLSPDYNAAHADHLHLDQADRGTAGWRACR
ncbi:extensin family protein [Sphingomonas sp. NY01]|uniref:extensin-like domain-containing protein n=1 Tax=Sphingomonas sp. NY01 TaxID=2968057 RepID=UPI00315CED39